jgi:hypothetical protein
MSTYSIILLINEQFSYYTAHQWAVLVLYCSSLSSWEFPVDLYGGILATTFFLRDHNRSPLLFRHDFWLILANCHSQRLLWDLTARLMEQWENERSPLYCCLIANLFKGHGVIAVLLWQTATLQLDCQLNWMLRRDCRLIVANCHSHTLLWDLAAFTKQGGTTVGRGYYCNVIAGFFEDCGVIAVLLWKAAMLWLHCQLKVIVVSSRTYCGILPHPHSCAIFLLIKRSSQRPKSLVGRHCQVAAS